MLRNSMRVATVWMDEYKVESAVKKHEQKNWENIINPLFKCNNYYVFVCIFRNISCASDRMHVPWNSVTSQLARSFELTSIVVHFVGTSKLSTRNKHCPMLRVEAVTPEWDLLNRLHPRESAMDGWENPTPSSSSFCGLLFCVLFCLWVIFGIFCCSLYTVAVDCVWSQTAMPFKNEPKWSLRSATKLVNTRYCT